MKMSSMARGCFFAAALISCLSYAAPPERPVMIYSNSPFDSCMSTGMVAGLKADGDGFLAVRSGPSVKHTIKDKILNGQIVWLCDDDDGDWLGIVYPIAPDESCEDYLTSKPDEPSDKYDKPYEGRCRSGWVKSTWIRIIAG